MNRRAVLAFERGNHPRGFMRQLAAIAASGDRTAALRNVRAPALVIHGTADPLIRPLGGRFTHEAIEGSRLELIEGMGHDIPEGAWPRLVSMIAEHARAAERRS